MPFFNSPDLRRSGTVLFAVACLFAILFTAGTVHAAERQILHGHVPPAVLTSQLVGAVNPSERLKLAIGLPLRHQDALELLLQQLYDPSSPNYHQYLNPEEFAERFGPTALDYQTLIQFAEANGLTVTGTHPNRTILDVSGSVAEVERVFHLNMLSYWRPDRGTFHAPDREPSLDLDVRILDISGLDNYQLPRPMGLKTLPMSQAMPLTTGSGPGGLFIGGDFRAAYAPGVTLTGTGQTVGLFELDGFFASDEKANFAQAGLPAVPTQTVLLDGFNGTPGSGNTEVILDIMMASYMAPGLSKVIVYEGEAPNDVLNRMATDNLAKQLSSSWGFSPINATTEQIFQQYIAQGQSLLQASGDSGSYENGVMPPSDDPNLTVVGGTSLTTSGPGGAWLSEATWSGSGGGVSTTYTIPSYQQATSMSANGGSTTMRNIPDVALTADIQIFLIQSNGQAIEVGGTSCAAPLWAGFIALANQQAVSGGKATAGFLNPRLYTIGNGSNYSADFHDITVGGNGGYHAIPGYDLATGWGTPAGQSLINDLSSAPAAASFTLSSSAATLSVSAGSSAVSTITVTPANGFSANVSLSATGLPKGVTASFSPSSTSGSSTLTLAAASTAVSGTTTVTVTGASGTLKSATTIGLTIAVPSFTLSASAVSLSLTPGSNATSTLHISPQNGFSGSVILAATGLPKGVTASFSQVSTISASTLTLMATGSVTAGTVNVTVMGTSGALKGTATIGLTIAVPTFTFSASPASLSLTPGSNAANSLTVSPQNGFSGTVVFAAAGLPKGVNASLTSATATSPGTMTLVAAGTVAAGTSTITVTGTSGSVKSTAAVSITITVPTFTLTAAPNTLSFLAGSGGSSTLTVNPLNGFSSNVSLTVSGLPTGVTASFSPASTASTSTLTFAAGATAAATTATVTVTGVSGTLKSTATLNLTILTPSFTLLSSPSSVSLTAGSSGASTLTVTPVNGFASNVNLTVSGLPKGVTANFSPASTAATSTLTFVASATATAITAPVVVTGTAGALRRTATISVAIITPNFTIAASPTSVSLAPGGSGTSTLTVTPLNGFGGTVTFTASGMPKGVTASFSSGTVTFTAASTAVTGTTTVTITGSSGTLSHTAPISLAIAVPDFTLSALPGTIGIPQGSSGAITVNVGSLGDFSGSVNLAASGLPNGVTASFGAIGSGGSSTLILTASTSATAGTTSVTVTGTSGTLSHRAKIGVTVIAQTAAASLVNLGSAFNVYGIVTDGSTFTNGGLDGGSNRVGEALSSTLLGVQKTVGGTTFYFGPANTTNAVSGQTIALPSGQFSKLQFLATGVNGSQPAQSFVVTYGDGTTSTFTQSLSDWFAPENFPGESKAITMPYRDTSMGVKDNRTFLLYGYSFTLTPGEQVSSITLPNNRNVAVLAMTLVP